MKSFTSGYIGHRIHHFESIDSTNDYALKLISQGKSSEGTLITAEYQSAGRGQIGRKWEGNPQENAYLSILLEPRFLPVEKQFMLNMIASLALVDTIQECAALQASIKWPNDIYLGDFKTCGILIQNMLGGKCIQHTIVGIGINVNQSDFPDDLPNPTSWFLESKKQYEINAVISVLCGHMEFWYEELKAENHKKISYAYIDRLYKCDEESLFMVDGEYFNAIIRGIDSRGKLVVEKEKKMHAYALHEIKMIIGNR